MTMRKLPAKCEHGVDTWSCGFYAVDDKMEAFFIPPYTQKNERGATLRHSEGCVTSTGGLRAHAISPEWEEDTSLWSELEVSRGAGRRRKVK